MTAPARRAFPAHLAFGKENGRRPLAIWAVKLTTASAPVIRASNGESKIDDIAVLDDILLAFQAQFSFVPSLAFAASGDEIVVVNHFGADEAALEIAVDAAGGAWCAVATADGPSLHLVLPHGKERDQVQQTVGSANETGARRFRETDRFQELALVLRVELGDLRLYGRANRDRLRSALLGRSEELGGRRAGSIFFCHVHCHQHRPAR